MGPAGQCPPTAGRGVKRHEEDVGHALFLENKHSKMRAPGINECMGCGVCTAICPEDAIVLVKGYEYTAHFKTIDRGSLMLPRLS